MKASPWRTLIAFGKENELVELKGRCLEGGEWEYLRVTADLEADEKESDTGRDLQEALLTCEQAGWLVNLPLYIDESVKKAAGLYLLQKPNKSGSTVEQWMEYCFSKEDIQTARLAGWLVSSSKTTVLTGAGMSTESNLPDFRSKEGWWRQVDPRTIAVPEAVENNYSIFADFYSERIKALQHTEPHAGHRILAEWENRALLHGIATQNVDGLHRKAGSRQIYELHGSLDKICCHTCGDKAGIEEFLRRQACRSCKGKLRPQVVLFGEFLPERAWGGALKAIEESELVLVIGTSLEVYPVNQLPRMTDGKTVYINAETKNEEGSFDLMIEGRVKAILEKTDALLRDSEAANQK